MKLAIPKITVLPSSGLLRGRCSKAIFITKHNLQINQDVVETETQQVTRPTAKNWLFLVEGHKKYSCAENVFLDSLIEHFEIRAEDPIEPPFTANVAESASIEKLLAALSILVMDYLDFMADSDIEQMRDEQLEAFFDLNVNAVAKTFEVSPKRLRKEFDKLKWNNEHLLGEQILNLSEKRRKLIDESNSLSKTKLVGILNENAQPNLFVMSGIEHATIFSQEKDM
ncbi:MAG: hypothetical protein HYY52_01960 [Candidatus Melainabacteria bacterium]|nr:hypothetical protein [Candidatus Melainabacteria bacterium]